MDAPSTSTDVGPGKRQLPSRSRRSTTVAVGGGELDLTILEATKAKDGEIMLKNRQRIWGATDSTIGEDSKEQGRGTLTSVQTDRYFSHEESMRSYREQIIIQTPAFTNLLENPVASTRTRLRPNDQPPLIDTTEAAYERRHKKYDTFEKRLKVREKEKLQHDHYKLKERIEQLRAIDSAAFLPLPADCFPYDDEDVDYGSQAGPSVNGANALLEGERRREEMLKAAMGLHERYRHLLPPERVPKKGPKAPEQAHYTEPEPLPDVGPVRGKNAKSTAPTRSPSSVPSAAPSISSNKKSRQPPKDVIYVKSRKHQQQRHFSPPHPPALHGTQVDDLDEDRKMHVDRISDIRTNIPSSPVHQSVGFAHGPHPGSLSNYRAIATSLQPHTSHATPPVRVIRDASTSDLGKFDHHKLQGDSISASRPTKRSRTTKTPAPTKSLVRDISVPTIDAFPGTPTATESPATSSIGPAPSATTAVPKRSRAKASSTKSNSKNKCLLIMAASHVTRDRASRRARDAFGAKIPTILGEEYEYELPQDILPDGGQSSSEEGSTYGSEDEGEPTNELPPDDEHLSMTGRQPDGEGESDEEIDELDDDARQAVANERLAMINVHHGTRPGHQKGSSGNLKVMDVDTEDHASSQHAITRSMHDQPMDEYRMQE